MRRLLPTGIAGIAIFALLTATAAGTAVAYFTTTGAGDSTPKGVSQLTKPTITAATPAAGGTVALTWGAVTPPGSGTVTYTITRNGGEAGGGCSSSLTATTCTDSGLEVGTYSYIVTAKWRSWTASSAPKTASVTVGTTHHFVLSAATTTPTAGASDNLTITAKDAKGSTVTTYTGSHNLTFSGASAAPGGTKPTVANSSGTAVNFGSSTALSFTSGVAAVSSSKNGLMKLYAVEEASIAVSDGSISSEPPLKVSVAPTPASKFVLGAASTTPTAGAADNLTVTAQDTYGNVATAYTGSHSLTFSGASASPNGILPTVADSAGTAVAFGGATAINFNAGVATASAASNGPMKLYKSGSTSIKATEGAITTPTALTVTVAPLAASEFLLASSASTLTAGSSANLTTTALDIYGNTDTNYTGLHSLTFSGASASPNATAPTVVNSTGTAVAFGGATAISFSAGVAKVSSSKNGLLRLYRAPESASLTVSDGSISNPTPVGVTVSPTSASKLALTNISISAGALGSPCLFTCTLTGLGNSGTVKAKVAVTDTYGNTVTALGSGHAVKVTTNGTGTISGTPLAIPGTGAAETETTFTYTSKASGTFTEIVTAATSEGTAYTSATLTASK
jgi:hypothetical protein